MALSTVCRLACNNGRAYNFRMSHSFVDFLRKKRSRCFVIPSTNVRNIVATNTYFKGNSSDIAKSTAPQESKNVWTIPNVLCGLRIAAAPLLAHFIIDHSYINAIAVLTIAGLTDLADGYIARNFQGQSSRLGTFLDPLADKILIVTLYSSMVFADLVPALLMEIIVFRDVLLLSAGTYIRYISIPPPRTVKRYFDISSSRATLHPTYLSKVNTVLQIVIAIVSLYSPTTSWITRDMLSTLWYTAGFSTIISGLSYVFSKNTFKFKKS